MKLPFFIVAVLLIAAGSAMAAYSIQVTWDNTKPALGANRLQIVVTDEASRPVAGAEVKIVYLMPSLPGRPPMMEYSTTASPVDSRYEATINLTMKGVWQMVVSVTAGQHAEKATSTFEVR